MNINRKRNILIKLSAQAGSPPSALDPPRPVVIGQVGEDPKKRVGFYPKELRERRKAQNRSSLVNYLKTYGRLTVGEKGLAPLMGV